MAGKFNGKAAIVTKVSLGIGETTALALAAKGAEESLKVAEFFRRSAGQWRSERRYYTLPDGETQEMVSADYHPVFGAGMRPITTVSDASG